MALQIFHFAHKNMNSVAFVYIQPWDIVAI